MQNLILNNSNELPVAWIRGRSHFAFLWSVVEAERLTHSSGHTAVIFRTWVNNLIYHYLEARLQWKL